MPSEHLNGIDVYFERSGEGRPLLFINGSGSTLATAGALVGVFSKKRRDSVMHATTVNGEPGVVFRSGGAVIQVVALCIESGVRAVYMTNNPDKLSR